MLELARIFSSLRKNGLQPLFHPASKREGEGAIENPPSEVNGQLVILPPSAEEPGGRQSSLAQVES